MKIARFAAVIMLCAVVTFTYCGIGEAYERASDAVVEMVIYDMDRKGPIMPYTKNIRRVYLITNNSDETIELQTFGVNGFNMINIDTGKWVTTGGTGVCTPNVKVPPHSRQVVSSTDRTTVYDKGIQPGFYRCATNVTLWYTSYDAVSSQTEIVVQVKY